MVGRVGQRGLRTDWCREPSGTSMDVKIKTVVQFTISGDSLESALAEYDELTVEGLLREVIDKAIACDAIKVQVLEGPNTLEDYDKQAEASAEG
jgi:hypothetical protein